MPPAASRARCGSPARPKWLLADVDEYRSLWGPEDAALTNTERLFDAGRITIEEQPELDLAVVRGPSAGEWHPMAVHTRTAATRLLLVHGPRVEFRYRYESWVQMASRRPALRVDLAALAVELTREDGADGRWRFEGVEHITPRMYREGGASSLTPENIQRRLGRRSGPALRRGIHTGDERHHAWRRSRFAVVVYEQGSVGRGVCGSSADPYRPFIGDIPAQRPCLCVPRIADRVRPRGCPGSVIEVQRFESGYLHDSCRNTL